MRIGNTLHNSYFLTQSTNRRNKKLLTQEEIGAILFGSDSYFCSDKDSVDDPKSSSQNILYPEKCES